ncbi:MAG: YlbF family regulator [Ruminococcaceae bacterium]|nr:YlbF family regulator [Oscillospiraceae bacterium]
MTVMEIAALLGEAIKKDARIAALNEARAAYEADPQVAQYMAEYNVQQKALSHQVSMPERDQVVINSIQNRIDELYNLISEAPSFVALNEAQEAVNEFMNQVNAEITYHITGEQPCTHDCRTCGGCGHSH